MRSARDADLVAAGLQRACVTPPGLLGALLAQPLPLGVGTICHGSFPDADHQQRIAAALGTCNDVIVRMALRHGLSVIDLRAVCDEAADYANPIEPSAAGGAKIARAIVQAVVPPGAARLTAL